MDRLDVLVIGGGQAGLAMAYHLQRGGVNYLVVDGRQRTGDSWRTRWDSLELFTPRRFSQLPGLDLSESTPNYPRKDDIAAYLEDYVRHHGLAVRTDFTVERLERGEGEFVAAGATESLRATNVVIATGPFHTPRIPECAAALDQSVWQGHSDSYHSPADIPPGEVLVVGGGNSAAQIAEELAVTHGVTLASNGQLIMAPKTLLGISIFWIMHLTGYLRVDTNAKIAKYARPYSDTIIGFGLRKLIKKGVVQHVPHAVTGCAGDRFTFADGSERRFPSVLWCTGYRPKYDWIKIDDALDDTGTPSQDHGVSPVPCLYWLGLAWQNRMNSALINGAGQDAESLLHRLR